MTPRTKKILLVGGAAVAGYIIYSLVKKPAVTNPKAALAAQGAQGVMQQISTATSGAEEDLGVSEDLGRLGSLGGAYR